MYDLISLENILNQESPFEGRTYISIYMPTKAPISAIISQLTSEMTRTRRSANYNVKGFAIMMLQQIIQFLRSLENPVINERGKILYALPKDHKSCFISFTDPKKGVIDLFTYNLDYQFFLDEDFIY